jgi:enoyl-CoA hydratase
MPSRLESRGSYQLMVLDEPRGNALGSATIHRLNELLDEVERADPAALIITGKERIFSVGLDLVEAQGLSVEALRGFVALFDDFFLRLLSYPIPMVAAVNGHAVAGGAVLALACDVRIGQQSALQMSLNETELGMPFPSGAFEVCRLGVPCHHSIEAIAFARRYTADEALAAGLLHAVVPDVMADAEARARSLARLGKRAVRAVRHELRAEFVQRAKANAASSRAAFVDAWRSDEATPRIAAVVAGLHRR